MIKRLLTILVFVNVIQVCSSQPKVISYSPDKHFDFILKASKESHVLLGEDAECTNIRNVLKAHSNMPVCIRVVEENCFPMGFAITSKPIILKPHEKMIGLQDLVVSKSARGKGYGSILLEDIEAEAQTSGCTIQLILLKNNQQAKKFYEKHKYESFGEGPGGLILRKSFNRES